MGPPGTGEGGADGGPGTLKVGVVHNGGLTVRGRLCGDGPEQTTVVRCTWVGPDDIALRE